MLSAMSPLWSVILTAFSLVTAYLIGQHNRWCWHFGLVTQGVWAIYAVATNQLAFLVTCVLFTLMYVRNLRKWRSLGHTPPAAPLADRVNGDHACPTCACAARNDGHAGVAVAHRDPA